MGQIVTVVGAGEGRSGVGTLASPMGNRTQGDPRVPTLSPCHPRPYEAKPLPCSFHKIPTLEGRLRRPWGAGAKRQGNRTQGDHKGRPYYGRFRGGGGAGIEVVVSLETERLGI